MRASVLLRQSLCYVTTKLLSKFKVNMIWKSIRCYIFNQSSIILSIIHNHTCLDRRLARGGVSVTSAASAGTLYGTVYLFIYLSIYLPIYLHIYISRYSTGQASTGSPGQRRISAASHGSGGERRVSGASSGGHTPHPAHHLQHYGQHFGLELQTIHRFLRFHNHGEDLYWSLLLVESTESKH